MSPLADRRARFRALHQSGCFAIPNPWDGGTALRLANAGFQALASTSAQAAPALVEARAWKPALARRRAVPPSHGLGMAKQPD